MKPAARLLGQQRPQPKLEHLPGRARLVARPRRCHGAELIADAAGVAFRARAGYALMAVIAFMVGLFDLIAFGVIFAGAVIVVQRLRGVA